jgi:hypothetical protein
LGELLAELGDLLLQGEDVSGLDLEGFLEVWNSILRASARRRSVHLSLIRVRALVTAVVVFEILVIC